MTSRPGLDPGQPPADNRGDRGSHAPPFWIVFALLTYFVLAHLWVGDVVTDTRVIGDQTQFLYRSNHREGFSYQDVQSHWVDVSWVTYYMVKFTKVLHLAVVVAGVIWFVAMGGLKRIWND